MQRREHPNDTSGDEAYPVVGHSSLRPQDAYEALMACRPHEEPDVSQGELLPLREPLADAIDTLLDPEELYIFNALIIEQISLRALGERLGYNPPFYGKSTIARKRERILETLRTALAKEPWLQGYLHE